MSALDARFVGMGTDPSTRRQLAVDTIRVRANRNLKSGRLDLFDLTEDEAVALATELLDAVALRRKVLRRRDES